MEAIWNRIHIEHPPNITWHIEAQKIDVTGLKKTLKRIIKDLESQNDMHTEAAILSRLIYRMKCKFRNDKGFKNMEKVNRALLNYLNLGLEKEYKNFESYIELSGIFVTLPSKQMLEYILVRTQGFAKLLARVEEVAKCAGTYLRTRIILGHAWTITLVAYAIISRIWILSKYLVKRSCIWYNGLYRFLNTFKMIGHPWLLKKDNLPSDLKSWLALSWLDENESSMPEENILKDKMFKLINVQDDNLDNDLTSDFQNKLTELDTTDFICGVSENISKSNISKNVGELSIHMNDDLGEVVNRSSSALNINKKKRKKKESLGEQKLSLNNEGNESDRKQTITFKSKKQKQKEEKSSSLLNDCRTTLCQLEPKAKKKKLVQSCNTISNKNVTSNFDNMKKSDLNRLLNKNCYPGISKLQWKIVKKKCYKLLRKSKESTGEKKQLLIKKAINIIRNINSTL
ncbi:uncharacterized protein LOC124425889 [Vespa crabro]|uniref:uncharacterized protein LOC124425889 n=1 Tax=Vespa crabro TaxID=7445 RepID=UPI001F01FE97|nr:uncharacterized protein LOC124425889 [Vespa crabro]